MQSDVVSADTRRHLRSTNPQILASQVVDFKEINAVQLLDGTIIWTSASSARCSYNTWAKI